MELGVPVSYTHLKLGLEYTDFTVSSSNEIQSVVESAVVKVDALYSPTDNTIAAGASQVGQNCKENKLPFVTGEEGMCMACLLYTSLLVMPPKLKGRLPPWRACSVKWLRRLVKRRN